MGNNYKFLVLCCMAFVLAGCSEAHMRAMNAAWKDTTGRFNERYGSSNVGALQRRNAAKAEQFCSDQQTICNELCDDRNEGPDCYSMCTRDYIRCYDAISN